MKNDELNKKVGINLKKARKEVGLTQVDLAKRMNMSPMMISRYEVGLNSIPYKRIERIAQILGKPVSYFFDGKVEKREYKLAESIVTQAPKDMLAFSLGKNANKQEAIKEAIQQMKNWYKKHNMQKSTKKSFTDWWEGK
ncbi:helix-turn-helix transcriptional regulator [Candidatus Dojkabacteria bacterium]|uniref:Helix-turn-helix transcriptional regulator n=1 Tax=Candidatus Dojkabacteria bacterium TaxID=2099670 RepID=A0A955HZG5_9BACT|nr:helix-turn-helix transcriptional regulator [Candidatus Dojkabacteria bacterium]MCB9790851.1 helix-turn-helix transcriptional regulator [Candidatus Nomurabacteria bacterium]